VYHGGYTIGTTANRPVWTPTVLDNGRKTFVIFPQNLSIMAYPMVRLIGANGPELVNPQLIDHVLVLDHLVPYALELRVGSGKTAEVVTITRGVATTITCPGDASCPQWPFATLARQARQ
jgi:type IV secretory pathway VirB9-like protein